MAVIGRAFAFAYLFSPTVIGAGMVGFPAPATLAFIAYVFDPEPTSRGMGSNQRFALQCFFITWVVLTAAYGVITLFKKTSSEKT